MTVKSPVPVFVPSALACAAYRYIPALRGVVLAHDRLEFLDKVATIKADCPFANCRVAFDATVWSPQVGMKLCESLPLLSHSSSEPAHEFVS